MDAKCEKHRDVNESQACEDELSLLLLRRTLRQEGELNHWAQDG